MDMTGGEKHASTLPVAISRNAEVDNSSICAENIDSDFIPGYALPVLTPCRDDIRPRLRGWVHAGALPLTIFAGSLLVLRSTSTTARFATAIYITTAILLFAGSALFHIVQCNPGPRAILRRIDHANIFLMIAGTYTPFLMLGRRGWEQLAVLIVVWVTAIAGALFRILWVSAPRWLCTALYGLMGWAAVLLTPLWVDTFGLLIVSLITLGGLIHTVGAVVYATKWPNPWPRTWAFHETFHGITVLAFAVHFAAIALIV